MESSTEPSIVSVSPSASSVCLNNSDPVMDSKKAAALAWYQRWERLVDLHEKKLKIQAEISEFCKAQAPPDAFGIPLPIRHSVAYKHSAKVEFNGIGREFFTCFLKVVLELEPEFFRTDHEKKDFVLSFFTADELGKFKAYRKKHFWVADWDSVRTYLGIN